MAIPKHMEEAMQTWVEYGVPHPRDMGGFMKAALTNDLKKTIFCADEANREAIVDWAVFLYNEVPSNAQGSLEALETWHKLGGLRGRAA